MHKQKSRARAGTLDAAADGVRKYPPSASTAPKLKAPRADTARQDLRTEFEKFWEDFWCDLLGSRRDQ